MQVREAREGKESNSPSFPKAFPSIIYTLSRFKQSKLNNDDILQDFQKLLFVTGIEIFSSFLNNLNHFN